jgi:hypothetical protein
VKTLLLLFILANSAVAITHSSQIEQQIQAKLHALYPNYRFALRVHLKAAAKVELDMLGESVEISSGDGASIRQIQQLEIFTNDPIPVESIAIVVGILPSQIKTSKLPGTNPAVPEVTSPAESVETVQHPLLWILAAGFFSMVLLLGVLALIFRNSLDVLSRTLTAAAKRDAGTQEPESIPHTEIASTSSFSSPARERRWSDTQLVAAFAECYWCESDQEAAALVQQHPKIKAYQALSFGADYIEYLRGVQPSNTEFLKDPYFLSPDSRLLLVSVRETPPSLISMLSELRFRKLQMSAEALVQAQISSPAERDFQLPPSEHRSLRPRVRVLFRDIQDEKQFLESGKIPEEVKMSAESLYCVLRLSDSDLKSVLNQVSLRELAEGWIAPDFVLNGLARRLPERKNLLLKEILVRARPSYSTNGFKKIVRLAQTAQTQSAAGEMAASEKEVA